MFHEPNTALIAPQSWAIGSSGKGVFVRRRTIRLNVATSSRQSSAVSSVSCETRRRRFSVSSAWWKGSTSSPSSALTPRTTSPYICTKRRYASHAKRGLTERSSPVTVLSFRPRFRTESIIPGMDTRAPERTETSSGFFGSPKSFSISRSSRRMASATSRSSPGGYVSPWS